MYYIHGSQSSRLTAHAGCQPQTTDLQTADYRARSETKNSWSVLDMSTLTHWLGLSGHLKTPLNEHVTLPGAL